MGCAQPQGNDNGLINHDPHSAMRSDHWQFHKLPNDEVTMASVVATARNGMLSIFCDEQKELTLLIDSSDGTELKETSVALTFDGNVATDYDWFSSSRNEDGWSVALFDDQKSFWPAIEALKRHRSVEVVVSESGKEWRRFQFTLASAAEAIDLALKECGMEDHG
jgi:hypothetical protein